MYRGTFVRSSRLDNFKVSCARCGCKMSANHRVQKLGVTPLCRDCREADGGLANLWKRKTVTE